MGQPVTTNPILIALINMTVVFGVLYGLSLIIRLIKVIDPTQKKNVVKVEPAVPAAAPAAAPVAALPAEDESQLIAVIAAAIAAYGYSQTKIASIRRISGGEAWAQAARLDVVNTRNQMF